MLAPPTSIPIVFVVMLLSGPSLSDEARRAVLADAQISPELLTHPGARITADQYASLLRLLIIQSHDEALGFLSRPLRPGSLALVARSALAAPDLAVALRRLTHAFQLLQDDFQLQVRTEGSRTGIVLHPLDASVDHPVFLHELLMRVFWRLLAWLVGGRLPVLLFSFAFERPVHADSYDKLFPGPVAFNQPCSAFWFEARHLRDPMRRDDTALRAFLADIQTYILLPQRGQSSLQGKLRAHLLRSKPHWPALEDCAAVVNMAPSTLQRRLSQEGTSFRALKDGLRRDMAVARLNSSQITLAALAGELGFVDSAAFQRAFKTWTGISPGTYRRAAQP